VVPAGGSGALVQAAAELAVPPALWLPTFEAALANLVGRGFRGGLTGKARGQEALP
jgi:hypothetical protein